jgi:HlyD family secretion protein
MEPTNDQTSLEPDLGVDRRKGGIRLKPIVTTVGLVALALLAVGWVRGKNGGAKDQYVVQEVGLGSVRKTVSASGTIQPWTVIDIKSKAGGRVNELAVELGDRVKKGQIIARIDPSDSQMSVDTAKADIDGAAARVSQDQATYRLQIQQTAGGIATARAQLESARANLSAAEARNRSARDQAAVQPTQTQAAIREAEAGYDAAVEQRKLLDSSQANDRALAQSNLAQTEANFKNAQASLARQKQLLEKGYVSRQAYDQQEAAFGVAQAQLNATKERMRTLEAELRSTRDAQDARVKQAKAQLESVRSQTDVASKKNSAAEADAAVRQARAQVSQAQSALNEAVSGRLNNDVRLFEVANARATTARAKATYQNAADTLAQTTVRAPVDGVVLQKYVEQGTIITSGMSMNSTGTSIVQIGEVSRLYVNVTVDETDIASVRPGQKVDVSVDAYPDAAFKGVVTRISPRAEVEQNVTTIAVRVEILDNSPTFKLIKPNMNATCEFIVGISNDVVCVPTEALRSDDQGDYVEVANGGKPIGGPGSPLTDVRVERRAVTIGLTGTDTAEITTGLKPGERVITQVVQASADAAATTTKSPISSGGPGGGGPPPGPPPGGGGK